MKTPTRSVMAAVLMAATVLALPGLARAASCNVTVVNVAFGDYDVFNTSGSNSTGTIKVTCGTSTMYMISLSAGSGSFTARTMTSNGQRLDYNLYTDPTRLSIWGDGTSGTTTVSATGTGGSYSVYARIPARQNVPSGNYTDTVTVTVTY